MRLSLEHIAQRIFLRHMLLLISVCACAAPPAAAQTDAHGRWENGISEAWWFTEAAAKDEIAAAQSRWEQIAKETRGAASDAWAGDYFIGDETHGSYLRLSPRGGFVLMKVNKCAAQVEDFSYGNASISPSQVRLIPERALRPRAPNVHAHGHQHADHNFVPVTFRGDRLLIPESEMSDFGDYVAGLGKFNENAFIYYVFSSPFFNQLREGESADASKALVVPSAYERFLKQPITGKIVAVGARTLKREYSYEGPAGSSEHYTHASVTAVTVNAGAVHGARRGLQLRVLDSDEVVRLTRVSKTSSAGIIIRSLDENRKESYYDHDTEQEKFYPPVAVGWELTTSPFN